MKNFRQFDKFYLLLIFPVLRLTMPYLQYRFRSATMIPFVLMWFLYVFQHRRYLIRDRKMDLFFIATCISCAVYYMLPLIFKFLGAGIGLRFRPLGEGVNIIIFIFLFSVVHYSLKLGKIIELKFLLFLLLFGFAWMAVAALRGGEKVVELGAARMVTALNQSHADSLSADYLEDASEAALSGMGTAASAYVSAFAIPLFLYSFFFVKQKSRKFICIAAMYANYINIKYSGINTPYMIVMLGLGLTLLAKMCKLRRTLVFIGMLMAIFMIIFSYNPKIMSFMASPLRSAAEATERYKQLSMRCASLADAVEGDKDTYAAVRYQLQVTSFESFLHGNWLVGCAFGGKGRYGGHSELLDCLAKYGLIGLFVMVLFFIFYLKYCQRVAIVCMGQKWLRMPYIFIGAWIFSSVPNPALLGNPTIILLIGGLGVFYSEFEKRWNIR